MKNFNMQSIDDEEEARSFTWTNHFYGCVELFLPDRRVRPLIMDVRMLLTEELLINISKYARTYDEIFRAIEQGIDTPMQSYDECRLQSRVLDYVSGTYNPFPLHLTVSSGFRCLVDQAQGDFILAFVQARLESAKDFLQETMKPSLNHRQVVKLALKYQRACLINYFLFAFIHESSPWLFTMSYLGTSTITELCDKHQDSLRRMIRLIANALGESCNFYVLINWENCYKRRKLFILRSVLEAAFIFLEFIKTTTNNPNDILFKGLQWEQLKEEFSEGLDCMWQMISTAFDEDFYQVDVIRKILNISL